MEVTGLFIFSMTIILVICILGLFGNILSAATLLQKDMRSTTTYLLLGLTASDCMLLILSFIRTLNNLHPLQLDRTEGLVIFLFMWDWICTSGTKYFTVAVSLERYVAVCHPVTALGWISEKRGLIYTMSVFLFTVLLAVTSLCLRHWKSYDIYVAIILHFLPFFTVLVLNIFIYFGIREFQKSRKELTSADSSMVSITRMLLCVVLVFGICYSFEFVRRILSFAGYFDPKKPYYDYTINHLADFFYVLNSSVNFIVYILMGPKFRTQFIKMMKNAFTKLGLKATGSDSHAIEKAIISGDTSSTSNSNASKT